MRWLVGRRPEWKSGFVSWKLCRSPPQLKITKIKSEKLSKNCFPFSSAHNSNFQSFHLILTRFSTIHPLLSFIAALFLEMGAENQTEDVLQAEDDLQTEDILETEDVKDKKDGEKAEEKSEEMKLVEKFFG